MPDYIPARDSGCAIRSSSTSAAAGRKAPRSRHGAAGDHRDPPVTRPARSQDAADARQGRRQLRPRRLRGRGADEPGVGEQPARESRRRDSRPRRGPGHAVREVKDEAERARLWKLAVAAYPPYEEYQAKITRRIPCSARSRNAKGAPTVKVVDAVARILKTEGTEFLSAYPTTPVIEAAAKADIRPVLCRQERVAWGSPTAMRG